MIVKREAKNETIKYLNSLKEKHSKLDNINFSDLECQSYFYDERLSPKEVQLLFSLRTRIRHGRRFKVEGSNLQLFHPSANLQKSSFLKVGDF